MNDNKLEDHHIFVYYRSCHTQLSLRRLNVEVDAHLDGLL